MKAECAEQRQHQHQLEHADLLQLCGAHRPRRGERAADQDHRVEGAQTLVEEVVTEDEDLGMVGAVHRVGARTGRRRTGSRWRGISTFRAWPTGTAGRRSRSGVRRQTVCFERVACPPSVRSPRWSRAPISGRGAHNPWPRRDPTAVHRGRTDRRPACHAGSCSRRAERWSPTRESPHPTGWPALFSPRTRECRR